MARAIKIDATRADEFNSLLLEMEAEDKSNGMESIKEGIISAYQKGISVARITKVLNENGAVISARTIQNNLEAWGVFSKRKPAKSKKVAKKSAVVKEQAEEVALTEEEEEIRRMEAEIARESLNSSN